MQEPGASFEDILARRLSRRAVLRGLGIAAAASLVPVPKLAAQMAQNSSLITPSAGHTTLTFTEVPRVLDGQHHLAEGYSLQPVIRWGDKVVADAPDFDPFDQTIESQQKQFGYNCDFTAYIPLDPLNPSTHGLLCVNHEFSIAELMFPEGKDPEDITEEQHRIEMEAHGISVIEVKRYNKNWQVVAGEYNRRITGTTPFKMTGPAAGHPRLRTSADPEGKTVLGTLGNCAGGVTPWGTYLSCEENIDVYFHLKDYAGEELANHQSMRIGKELFHRWDLVEPRFDVTAEPNEANRFGWVVEIDPMKPDSQPLKRTALGRFKHESATCVLTTDRRVAVYSGDDERFQHIYRYVSDHPYEPGLKAHNRSLLENGVLSAARFDDDGTMSWLPLVFGEGPLTAENGFHSQADVLIETRRAAKLVGATPMDRPEDIDVNPVNGHIYVALTKNPAREETDAVNRRAPNPMGYVLELIPPNGKNMKDHLRARYEWNIFLEGGDPQAQGYLKGDYAGEVSANGWLACPDNFAVDPKGRLWITTDGQEDTIECAETLYAADTAGPGRGITRAFFRGPAGSEMTGPSFTPDGRTLFLSIQHPADGKYSTFEQPYNRWPDYDDKMPPRPTVIAITKDDGGVIGG